MKKIKPIKRFNKTIVVEFSKTVNFNQKDYAEIEFRIIGKKIDLNKIIKFLEKSCKENLSGF